ncbi:OmpA family protein [Polyangium sp. y55x31]|uniref:OmpA family protein n=1 Tax=Polyangium sp. y55x31 TaxID=3042688 RepID=UPI002482F811|nr:OmpA family protein [Polyangium sp. y55x31]MDI1480810.1 OmpA family protein [Polyangium sp. y55x31]
MNRCLLVVPFLLASLVGGCGHSEDEWRAQLAKYNELQDSSEAKKAELEKQLAEAKQRVADLEKQLQDAGADVKKMSSTLEDQEKALAEYKARAKQLEAIKARFDLLRKKLDELTKLGLAVSIRRNRMVISLPGDVLFDTGKVELKKEGEDILKKVAQVIKADKSLVDRDYQVAGHTDNQPLNGGPYQDNWGLSLMRARSVLLFLVGKGGALPRAHWSAAGFADTDPVANNGNKDGQQKNRRCDLIVVPDVDEMIDLTKLTKE